MSCQIIPKTLIVSLVVVGLVCWGPGIWAKPSPSQILHLQVPILGTSLNTHHLPMGLVSAMVALSVVAMAKGEPPLEGRILTGSITDQGHIGAVGGLQLKILAAYYQRFQRVFIPSVYDERDGDWRTPFLMHVSPVRTVEEAYLGLTGHQYPHFFWCLKSLQVLNREFKILSYEPFDRVCHGCHVIIKGAMG